MRRYSRIGGIVLLTMGLANYVAAQDAAKSIRPTEGATKLFNGKNLEGLYTWLKDTKREDPRKVFRVTDGMLHITGDGLGSVITTHEYRDYHLVLEFKWGDKTYEPRTNKAKDSGLLIHSVGEDGGYSGTWMPSIEVQIIEGGCGDFILVANDQVKTPFSLTVEAALDRDKEVIWQKGGNRQTFDMQNRKRVNWYGRDPDWKDELGFRGKNDVESPAGQWTRMDAICDGSHIQTYVNGILVNEAFESHPQHGKIQLQAELAEVYFRRWELWPVGKGPKPAKPE